jgi:hypothetical protein
VRRNLFLMGAGLLLVPAFLLGSARGDLPKALKPKGDKASSCGKYGTSVEFVSTPSEAARQAKKAEKLVFVLHVSGYFEDPKLT